MGRDHTGDGPVQGTRRGDRMPSLTMAEVLLEETDALYGHEEDLLEPDNANRRAEIALRRQAIADLGREIAAAATPIDPDSQQEYEQIGKVYEELQRHDTVALCLSGGGIRSATFALGVLEALAQRDLLHQFHYLSTVSGGGYIGSWLSAWIHRRGRDEVFRDLKAGRQQQVRPPATHPVLLPDREPEPLHGLRADSNYLTPKLGLLSADTWTGVALYVRNVLMNWVVIGSFILVAVLLPYIAASLLGIVMGHRTAGCVLLAVSAVLVLIVWAVASANRPTWGRRNIRRSAFIYFDLLPFLAAAIAWVFALRSGVIDPDSSWSIGGWIGPRTNFFVLHGLAGAALALLGWLIGACPVRPTESEEPGKRRAWDGAATAVAGAIFGLILASGALLLAIFAYRRADAQLTGTVALILGPLWFLQAQVFGEAFLVGLRSAAARGTDDREWLARSAGWYGAAGIGWALLCGLVLAGPAVVACVGARWLASAGGVSGIATTLLGKSSLTNFKSSAKVLPANVALAILAPVFALCLVIGLSWVGARILYGSASALRIGAALGESPYPPLLWAIGIAALGLVTSYFVNINRFSLHSVYRNRLIRGYLGASNPDRLRKTPAGTMNLFTGFDRTDNLSMSELWERNRPDRRAFLHVVNMALNVVSTRNLAWQERKAEPFTTTALHAGSDRVGFRKTADYAQNLSLGTAMAISGAAASPNMGYHSSPALTFLLALFNVRLGWWLGNPGPEGEPKPGSCWGGRTPAYRLDGPKLGAWWLAQETLGLTTDDRSFVYLSDGGHFENLGLYEMVRRRCRYIVLSDAGADPKFVFEDLGNAVRKIRIDLGISIYFPFLDQLKASRGGDRDQPYWSVGVIEYPEKNARGDAILGYILYLKPALRGDEPADVRSYAAMHAAYPHESTSDQWFSESQFESYRALGEHIMSTVIQSPRGQRLPAPLSIVDIIRAYH